MKKILAAFGLAFSLSACTIIVDLPSDFAPYDVQAKSCSGSYSFNFKVNASIQRYTAILVAEGQYPSVGNAKGVREVSGVDPDQRSFANTVSISGAIRSQDIVVKPLKLYVRTQDAETGAFSAYVASGPVTTCP